MRKAFSLLIAVLLVFATILPVRAQAELAVYYAGPASSVRTALELAPQVFRLVTDPAEADVLVLNGEIPAGAAERYHAGAGLVLFLAPELSAAQVEDLLGFPLTFAPADEAVSLAGAPGVDHPLLRAVLWNSAPQIRERLRVTAGANAQPLVSRFDAGEMVLWAAGTGGKAFVFNAFLGEQNPQVQEWAYFNYLIYHLTTTAGGTEPLSFGDYPASPVPHRAERLFLVAAMGAILSLFVIAFVLVRRYSRAHPEALDVLVGERELFMARQANTDWEEVGFHRPLGGFMLAFMLG